jgi:hypothetical protein
MDDIRRANVNMLNTSEIFARTIFELSYTGGAPVTLEQYVPRDIRMEEFLSWQLARRLQDTLTAELKESGAAEVDRCGGDYRGGEFAFTLNVRPAAGAALDEATVQQLFAAATKVIVQVLSSYDFKSYDTVRLILPASGRNLVMPKAHLEVFR